MARLLRLHFASVGHADARFSPLTLDFRRPGGAAANTVLWLRNGGGKSSLLNLFYSTFAPQTKNFLGKRADGRSRQLGDYVQGRDLACVVSEWEMAASPTQPSDIRVIGQVLCWKDAVQAAHDESRLERCFFTFRSGGGITFDSVPVYGLVASPSLSLDQFRNWLNWLKGEHRSLEPESRSQGQKGDWQRVLRDVGFDEELFQYQLIMNGREGGADELFRVRSTDDFVRLFLEIAYPPQHANETAKTLTGVREKLMRLPRHRMEESFVLELIRALHPLESAVGDQEKAAAGLAARRHENFLLHAAIENSVVRLEALLKVAQVEVSSIEDEEKLCKQRKLQLQEYRLNYEYLIHELAFSEAEAEHGTALQEQKEAEHEHDVAAAAEALETLRKQEERLAGLRAMQAEFLVEQQPELEKLQRAGAVYAEAVEGLLAIAKHEQGVAHTRQAELLAKKQEAEKEHTAATGNRSKAEAELRGVDEKLRRRDEQRATLRDLDLVQDREKASAAVVRREAEISRRGALAEQQEAEAVENEQQAEDARSEVEKATNTLREQQAKAEELSKRIERGRVHATALRENKWLQEAASTDAPDLEFPLLPELLRQKERACLNRIIATRLDAMDDERATKYQETEHLLPPSLDVEHALDWLKTRKVLTAMPAYRFLSQNERDVPAAVQRIRHDPARCSGIMVNSQAEFQSLRERDHAVPGLRHPVAITLTGFATADVAMPETLVLMPESVGAFNQAAASATLPAIQQRLAQVEQTIQTLESERQETAQVFKRLTDFRSEFGDGALARLEQQHSLVVELATEAERQVGQHRETVQTHQARAAGLRAQSIATRKELLPLAAGLEKLKGYISEFERHEENWTKQRADSMQEAEELAVRLNGLAIEIEDLGRDLNLAVETMVEKRNRVTELEKERAVIAHILVGEPSEAIPVEQARSRYQSLLSAFEHNFGNNVISGQITEAEGTRVDLEARYLKQRASLDHNSVARYLAQGAVVERKVRADRHRVQAQARVSNAVTALANARTARKPRAHKQGLGLPAGAEKPASSAEARAKEAEYSSAIEQVNIEQEGIRSRLAAKKEDLSRMERDLAGRRPLLDLLADHIEQSSGAMPTLPEEQESVRKLATDAKQSAEELAKAHKDAASKVDRFVDGLLAISRREDFAELPLIAREKLPGLPKAELLARCGELKAGYEQRQKVLHDEIESFTQDKKIVVQQLHNVAREALSLLTQAERASVMPETMSGWAAQPFLRIRAASLPEPAGCHERLGLLVDRMVQEKAIPHGYELAFAAAREIAAPFRVTLLKPELVLSPQRHDIVEFGNFSDGERLTAAILLYASLAQLRKRSREGDRRSHEAGVLILDNPFGKASLRDFVEIQMRVASQMGVQLVYATGINDLGALEVFPRIVRLRNTHRDRRTGDKLVTQDRDPSESGVEAAAANLRP